MNATKTIEWWANPIQGEWHKERGGQWLHFVEGVVPTVACGFPADYLKRGKASPWMFHRCSQCDRVYEERLANAIDWDRVHQVVSQRRRKEHEATMQTLSSGAICLRCGGNLLLDSSRDIVCLQCGERLITELSPQMIVTAPIWFFPIPHTALSIRQRRWLPRAMQALDAARSRTARVARLLPNGVKETADRDFEEALTDITADPLPLPAWMREGKQTIW